MQAEMIANLVKATEEVFATMLSDGLEFGAPIEGASWRSAQVVGTVGFTGAQSGLVAFYSSMQSAREITARLLGLAPAEVNGEIADAIGEMTNMIAGSFRTRMADGGAGWAISVPIVTIGSDFDTVCVSEVRRVLCPFRMHGGGCDLFVELIVTRERE